METSSAQSRRPGSPRAGTCSLEGRPALRASPGDPLCLLLGALAPEPPDGFPGRLPSPQHPSPSLWAPEEDGRVSTKQVAGPASRAWELLLANSRAPEGSASASVSQAGFLPLTRLLLDFPRVCFCFSFRSNSHLAHFSLRRVLSPRRHFFFWV